MGVQLKKESETDNLRGELTKFANKTGLTGYLAAQGSAQNLFLELKKSHVTPN